ncbi:lysM and putative peptidoglycan-binding domain-containing protein 2-like isoform X2 [Ruditapes philippinarum]|uniref:lysM and putative peptidoglycan-binding domain-containing protein 2-like isoform X2 n=1 Tax=Ruditapes philippinarum TaxID=129788 RepID=UPI00295C17F2|nr:lysM and putative peptidoglycan-binding domain-containing protein 2-like isoform X2 [Ruditapes philippinarum]
MSEDGTERKLFGNIARNQTKYGSTTKPQPKFTKYVKHIVSRVDTLQGISLKYGATVEQIKRENKLWTNDSLFLREHLYIPVTSENSYMVQDDWELLSSDEVRSRSNSDFSTSDDQCSSGACNDVSQGAKRDTSSANDTKVSNGSESSGMDFFSKYDSSFANLKSKVENLEKSSSHRDDNLSSLIPRRHSDITHSSRAAQPTRKISLEDPDSPVLVIRSNMKSSKVKTAVKRSEKANDDLFEL